MTPTAASAQEEQAASPSASPSPSGSASPSPTQAPPAFESLDLAGAEALPCNLETRAAADQALAAIATSRQDIQYCVISSADQNLGCYVDRESAEEQRRATGRERLLDVIGTTARLEQRQVLAIIPPGDPAFASTPITCETEREREQDRCSFQALEQEEVVYADEQGNKLRLGPSVINGSDISDASAILGGTVAEWQVQFELTGEATQAFADATTAAVNQPRPRTRSRSWWTGA